MTARSALVTAAVAAAAFLAGARLGWLAPPPRPDTPLVDDVLRAIRAYYVDSLDDAAITALAARAIVERLDDPYAGLEDERQRRRQAAAQARTAGAARVLEDRIGYVALTHIGPTAAADLRQAITAIRPDSLGALILDLRDNPGGGVEAAVHVADLFLDRDLPIGTLQGRSPRASRRYVAASPQAWPHLPLVILVNARTRSAAELVAAVLQEHDRAAIVGEPTIGKGSAQQSIRLNDSLSLRLTTGRWLMPSGRRLERGTPDSTGEVRSRNGRQLNGAGGVHPDLVVESGRQLSAAVELLRHATSTTQVLELAAAMAAAQHE